VFSLRARQSPIENGHYKTLNEPNGTYGTVATGINDHGQIVGYFINSRDVEHGFLYSNGTYTRLNDPLGTHDTEVLGFNNYGKIVGIFEGVAPSL
jgi:probable HAF family extracellular repeat protein